MTATCTGTSCGETSERFSLRLVNGDATVTRPGFHCHRHRSSSDVYTRIPIRMINPRANSRRPPWGNLNEDLRSKFTHDHGLLSGSAGWLTWRNVLVKDPGTLVILVYIKLTHGRHSPRCSFFRLVGTRVAPKCLKLPFIKFRRYDKARACIDWLAARTKYPSRCQVGADTLSRGQMADTFIRETMSRRDRRVLWALLCPFVGFLRHRSLTARAFIGEIPEPMTG